MIMKYIFSFHRQPGRLISGTTFLAVCLLAFAGCGALEAATTMWTGLAGNGYWNTALNWGSPACRRMATR